MTQAQCRGDANRLRLSAPAAAEQCRAKAAQHRVNAAATHDTHYRHIFERLAHDWDAAAAKVAHLTTKSAAPLKERRGSPILLS